MCIRDSTSAPEDPGAENRALEDVAGSLTLSGDVALGTGVVIGAGILVLTGQTTRLAGDRDRRVIW